MQVKKNHLNWSLEIRILQQVAPLKLKKTLDLPQVSIDVVQE